MNYDPTAIGAPFQIEGDFVSAEPYGSGHIHDTFVGSYRRAGSTVRYVHQRINRRVFARPIVLMDNICRITNHIREKLINEGAEQVERRVLHVVPTLAGKPWHADQKGDYWRTFHFIEGARTHDTIRFVEQAFGAARAFGRFQSQLVDLPGPALAESIPDFHNAPAYFASLEQAVEEDLHNRAAGVRAEIDFVESRSGLLNRFLELAADGGLPERIAHNDTKVNNVLIDERTREPLAVIDLDTVMPGRVLDDFGDLVRTAACAAEEDETDLSRVYLNLSMFEALVRGYLSTARFLTRTERDGLGAVALAGHMVQLRHTERLW